MLLGHLHGEHDGVAEDDFNDADLVAKARAIYKMRRRRDAAFEDSDLFADPAWDLMLTLYIDGAAQANVSVSSACYAAHVPATTALRWIEKLERMDLLHRTADPFDGRRHHLSLTRPARARMARVLSSI